MYGESQIAVICKSPKLKEIFSSAIHPSLATLPLSLSIPSAMSIAPQIQQIYTQNSFSFFDSAMALNSVSSTQLKRFRVVLFVFYSSYSDSQTIREALEAFRALQGTSRLFLVLFMTDLIPSSESQFKRERENFEKVSRVILNSEYPGPVLKLFNWISEKRVNFVRIS